MHRMKSVNARLGRLDVQPVPLAVAEFRSQLCRSARVIISSPEYAHGVPGVRKNALDRLVASGDLYEKPVALFSASTRGTYAQASLRETLNVMMARVVPEACISEPFRGKTSTRRLFSRNQKYRAQFCSALARFADAISRE